MEGVRRRSFSRVMPIFWRSSVADWQSFSLEAGERVLDLLLGAGCGFIQFAVFAGQLHGQPGFFQVGKAKSRAPHHLQRQAGLGLGHAHYAGRSAQEVSLSLRLLYNVGAVSLLVFLVPGERVRGDKQSCS